MTAARKKVVLTDRALKALEPAPAGKRYVIWDAVQPHLGVRVTDRADEEGRAAVRSFIVVKRHAAERHPITHVIGRYNPDAEPGAPGTLAHAREAARAALGVIAQGWRPAEVAAARHRDAEAERRRHQTFGDAVVQFITDELHDLRSAGETEAILRRDFLGQEAKRRRTATERGVVEWVTEWSDAPDPAWRDRPITEITRRDIIEHLDGIKRRRGKHAARHALSAVRRFFNWCAEGERFGIEASPCAGVRDKTIGIKGKDLARKRVLADDELRDVWAASDARGYPFGPLVRLLLLTGQRLNDIAAARWSEIDLDGKVLTVPPERYKTGVAHEVPLAPRVVDILKALPRFKNGHVFTTTAGARPVSGVSKMKAKLDAAMAERREAEGREAMAPWTLHDIRRTVRTRLVGDCGIDAFTAERVIGHALPGLHGVYDQGTHRGPKREAAERWAAQLLSIVEPPPTKPAEAENVIAAGEVERRRKRRRA